MDITRLGFKRNIILSNEKGQSSTEYIMLIGVVVIIVGSVFKSAGFKNLFGSEGLFAKTYKEEVEFSYRHTLGGREKFRTPNYRNSGHKSYKNGSETRFFGANEQYGR
jgi:hypothetical protein